MTGWQRFFLLLAACGCVLIFWPQYNHTGLAFLAMFSVLWICLIVLLSVLINMLALYKVEFLHHLISVIFGLVMLGSLLYYFPLEGGQTPFSRMRNGQWPTMQDVKLGMKRVTFNFDFVRRNVHRDANYINQQMDETTSTTQELKKMVKKQQEKLNDMVDQIASEE